MQAECTFFKTGTRTYLANKLNCVTKHNSKLTWIFTSYSTRHFINHSEDESDFFSEISAPTYLSILMIQEITEKSKHSIA